LALRKGRLCGLLRAKEGGARVGLRNNRKVGLGQDSKGGKKKDLRDLKKRRVAY